MSIGEIGNVDKREIVYVQTFLVPKGEPVDFSFSPTHYDQPSALVTYNKKILRVRLRIAETGEEEVSVHWVTEGPSQVLVITLPSVPPNRWGPAVMETPIKVGEVSGRPLGFYAAFSPGPGTGSGLVTIQFMLGGGLCRVKASRSGHPWDRPNRAT
jgi:hypothetical protein